MNTVTQKVCKKYIGYFFSVIILLAPSISLAGSISGQCAKTGFTIATINGVFTIEQDAKDNTKALKNIFGISWNNQEIDYQYLFNPPHLGGAGDILKSIQQGVFDSETVEDYDLVEMLQDASGKVATQKLLLVAHSQGNFYANSFYDMVADKAGGAPAESIGVYSVATPSSRVAGGGKWLTSDTDKAIAGIVGHIPFRKIMEPNAHIELQNGDDFWGHSFSGVYLKYQSEKIISDIKSSLDRLKTSNTRDARKPCLAPPELSLAHKIQGGAFAFADPVANGIRFVAFELPVAVGQYTERAALAATKTVVSAVAKVIQIGAEKIVEAAQTIKQTFSEVFKRDEFQLAQIVNLSEAQSDQSGQAVQSSGFKQCSFDTQKSPSRSKVIISEVAWMGGASSANDEWIELKNISGNPLDISGYQLLDKNGQIKIVFEKNSIIPANGFYLLERTDDASVPEAKADVVYSGILSNSDEALRLFDGGCDLIDEASASPNWPAGDNTVKKTMERNSGDSNWHASAVIGGTPKKENSQSVIVKKQETVINPSEETGEEEEITPQLEEQTKQQGQIQQAISGPPQTASFKQCSFQTNLSPSRQKIVINEAAWMGGASSANDEWIELKNISGAEINLNGYQLIDQGGQIKITFESGDKIPANGFYLLERTDDNSAPSIAANKIYTGALSNTNEGLRFFDGDCGLVDEVLASPDWPAGDSIQKRSMERSPDLSWHNYNGLAQNNILGTPKAENSASTISSGGGGGSGSATSEQQSTTDNIQQQEAKILINEIQTYPTGERFIELYNPNNSAVDLTNWYIQRKTQSGSSFSSLVSKTYFENKIINAYGYFLISRASLENADIILDNLTITESNTIQIKNSNGEIIDKIGWGSSDDCENNCASEPPTGQSIQRRFQDNTFFDTDNNAQDFEIQTCPSPKAKICQQVNQTPSAFFVYTPQNPNTGDLITFNAASSTDADGEIILYEWDFGDNATSSATTTFATHTYFQAGDYQVGLIVFDNNHASSTASTIISTQSPGVDHLVISEIMAGAGAGRSNEEFVEFYNPTNEAVSLSSWSLKRKTSQNSTSTLNLVSEFSASSTISAKGFFLVAHQSYPDYSSSTTADFFYTNNSNPLAYEDDAVILYNNTDEVIDEVAYQDIEVGKSLERKSLSGGSCVSAQNDGEFLGNGCDTDNAGDFSAEGGPASDWEIRNTPNPQNSLNLPEPRGAPTTPSNFSVQYSSSTKELIFNWDASSDYSGATSTLTYKMTDISNSSSTLVAVDTALAGAEISINERGRSYVFSIQAFDKGGLGSLKSESQIDIPSIKQTILAQQLDDTAEAGADNAIIQKLSLSPSEFQGSFNRIELQVFSEDGGNYVHSVWLKEINPDNALDYNLLFYTNYADFGLPNQWNTMVYDVGNITTKGDKIYEFAIRGRTSVFGGPGSWSNSRVKGSSNPDSYPYGNADQTADLYFKIYLEE